MADWIVKSQKINSVHKSINTVRGGYVLFLLHKRENESLF